MNLKDAFVLLDTCALPRERVSDTPQDIQWRAGFRTKLWKRRETPQAGARWQWTASLVFDLAVSNFPSDGEDTAARLSKNTAFHSPNVQKHSASSEGRRPSESACSWPQSFHRGRPG